MRTCVACRTERPRSELLRVVRQPDRSMALDLRGDAPGRGAYLCADGTCRALALKRSAVQRALGVALDPSIRTWLEEGGPAAPSLAAPPAAAPMGGSHGP